MDSAHVISLRLHDPSRNPTSWTEIIRPGQYVAFAKTIDTGAPCDPDGRPYQTAEAAICLLFESLAEAEIYCQQRVEHVPEVRFDIFDSTGRAQPPLLVIVHRDKTGQLEGSPRGIRLRNRIASTLALIALVSFWYDFVNGSRLHFFPTLLGINLIVVTARLFQLNRSYAHADDVRRKRLAEHQRTGGREY